MKRRDVFFILSLIFLSLVSLFIFLFSQSVFYSFIFDVTHNLSLSSLNELFELFDSIIFTQLCISISITFIGILGITLKKK